MSSGHLIFIAGHGGLVGRALVRRFKADPRYTVLTAERNELDLRDKDQTNNFLRRFRPETIIISAAKVGGISANMAHPVGFLTDNLEIQNNLMLAAISSGCKNLMMLGSSCIYPRLANQPISEDCFMTGPLEPTNESYAIAKIAGIRLAQAIHQEHGVRVVLPMPCNVYGPGDHFDLERAHVASAMVRRFVDAKRGGLKSVTLWGTGSALREFIYSEDLADACHFLLHNWNSPEIINVGSGSDVSIKELAGLVARLVDFDGELLWDQSRPDGMPRKLLDVSKLTTLGWESRTPLDRGLEVLIDEYRQSLEH